MTAIKGGLPSRERLRVLKQYKDLSEEEFNEIIDKKLTGYYAGKEFEDRIKRWIDKFAEDYDLSDLKANDKLVLRALAQAHINLEDLENFSFNLRAGGIQDMDITKLERMNNMMSVLRKDISSMQTDLKITRKIRKGDKEESVISTIENLQKAAKEFYQNRMFYVWCDKCNMLLFTGWFLYPDEHTNKLQLVCKHRLETGELCNNKITLNSKQLLDKRGTNKEDVPEFFK